MPTTLPRTQVTHTPAIAHALEVASLRWPSATPLELIQAIAEDWVAAAESEQREKSLTRAARIRANAGRFSGVYGDNYLAEIREGWRE